MRKKFSSLALFSFSIATLSISYSASPEINTTRVVIVNPNAIKEQVLNKLDAQARNFINDILNKMGMPPILKTPMSKVLYSLYEEVLCRIPNPLLSPLEAELPTSISVPLSCSSFTISFSPIYKQILETADGLSGGTTKLANRCLNGDLNACKELAKKNQISTSKILEEKNKNDVAYTKGLGKPPFEQRNREEINKEYQNTVKALSLPSVESTPEQVIVNEVSETARMNAERDAGKSTGELLNWGKNDTQNIPKPLIPYYRYVAEKQFTRNAVIQALQERIKQERVELARLQSAIRAYCDKEWQIKTIPPVRGGGSIGSLLGKGQREKIFENLLASKKINVEKTLQNAILARIKENLPVVRGCCCPIPQIESAKDSVNSHIEVAKREIEGTIERVGNMLANVISEEEYRTRQQINADSQAMSDSLKQTLCLKAQLDFQRNKIELLQLEVEVAKLQVLYSLLNKEEMKEYKEKLKTLRKMY